MGYEETMARTWEREKNFLDGRFPVYTTVGAAQENYQYEEFPVISLTAMREKGIQFLCSWSKDQPYTCEQPAIRLNQGDALCNRHFLNRIGAIREFENSAVDNIKQAEEFKIRLDNLHGSKENELALNRAKYSLLREAGWNLRHYKEIPSLNKVASGEIKIDEIGTERREALKEALALENKQNVIIITNNYIRSSISKENYMICDECNIEIVPDDSYDPICGDELGDPPNTESYICQDIICKDCRKG